MARVLTPVIFTRDEIISGRHMRHTYHAYTYRYYGIRNPDRRRGLKLFTNGHLDPSTYEMRRGIHGVTGHQVVAVSLTCVASM